MRICDMLVLSEWGMERDDQYKVKCAEYVANDGVVNRTSSLTNAMIATINSTAFPKDAFKRPPRVSPVRIAISSVE